MEVVRLPEGWEFCTPEQALFQLPNGNWQSFYWLQDSIHTMGYMESKDNALMLARAKDRGLPLRRRRGAEIVQVG